MNLILALIAAGVVVWILYQEGGSVANVTVSPIMQAIATAEGGLKNSSNNPGSLTQQSSAPGYAGDFNSAGVALFQTLEDGWNALANFLSNLFGGGSWYTPSMTVQQFANSYVNGPYGPQGIDNQTTGSTNWASNFINSLSSQGVTGVTADTPMGDVVSAAS